ncbi:MAG: NADH-quinone oxidoreductase subunit A [candidate division Zixibacteria bacterium]|nr:NADH-quinone oxidoreductase subunit A [candidate division Zixibacteria bacterium]
MATFLGVALTVMSIILGRRTKLGKKFDPYECGMEPVGTTKDPVPVHFFMIAISFILFDLEVIFLLPWAVVARDLGWFGFGAISIFVVIILVGYVYELGRGALTWE